MPRPRITTRSLMILVAVVGVLMAYRQQSREKAVFHLYQSLSHIRITISQRWPRAPESPRTPRDIEEDKRWAWHAEQSDHYSRITDAIDRLLALIVGVVITVIVATIRGRKRRLPGGSA